MVCFIYDCDNVAIGVAGGVDSIGEEAGLRADFYSNPFIMITMVDQPGFSNPPWVYSPSEVMKWINATYPTKVSKSRVGRSSKEKYLNNIELKIDLNVEKHEIVPSNYLLGVLEKLVGKTVIEEQFALLPTAELFIRGLAQAKFHNMSRIKIDDDVIYDHPEKKSDIRKTIEVLTHEAHNRKDPSTLYLKSLLRGVHSTSAEIWIQKIHAKKEHSVLIRINGDIEESLFHRFLNYLKNHLSISFAEK